MWFSINMSSLRSAVGIVTSWEQPNICTFVTEKNFNNKFCNVGQETSSTADFDMLNEDSCNSLTTSRRERRHSTLSSWEAECKGVYLAGRRIIFLEFWFMTLAR